MNRHSIIYSVAGVLNALALLSSPAAFGQTPQTGTTDIKKALETRKEELSKTKERARSLETDVNALRTEREKITTRLLETAALIQKSEGQLTTSEGRLEELGLQEKMVRGSLNQRYAQISKLLSALQRMGRNPPPVMITRREDALKMVRSAMLLASAFPGMRNQALALSKSLSELVTVMDKIRNERENLKAETQRMSEMRVRLAGLMAEKKQSLAERRAELDKVRVAAAEISRSVEDLNGLFQKLDQVSKKTAAEDYEQELKKRAELNPPVIAPAQAPQAPELPPEPAKQAENEDTAKAEAPSVTAMVTLPPKTGAPNMVELAPNSGSLVPGSPARISPSIAFKEATAKLPLPAQGRRVLSFGDKTQYGGQSKGLVIETRWNAQITSPCDGWIVYAGEFRSYGQLLIINAGGGYHVLLAGLSQIDAQPGQFVLAAEPVGTMIGKPRSSRAKAGAPVLYVEFRKDGDPINPDPWWVDTQQKAQIEQKVQG